jgi:hypothetical protein
LLPQISTSSVPSKIPSMGKDLRVTRLLKSEEVAASTGFRLVQNGDTCSCFSPAQGCESWQRLCRKMRSVLNTSSYPLSMFKEFYNKLLAIKNYVSKLFGQPLYVNILVKLNSTIWIFSNNSSKVCHHAEKDFHGIYATMFIIIIILNFTFLHKSLAHLQTEKQI